MRRVSVDSYEALEAFLDSFGPDALYRGQTKEYLTGDGTPSISTSFARLGCHPPRMLKWLHYASEILKTYVKGFDGGWDAATDQAILQHYGWRSFFIDATSDAAVACWFAGHKYDSKPMIDLSEDYYERPVMIVHEKAWYSAAEGAACMYVLSRKSLRQNNLGPVDLVEITTSSGRPRFLAQSAFMVGPLKANLPMECIAACVTADASLFREYARKHGNHTVDVLFPGPSEDPVLAALFSLPWEARTTSRLDAEMPFFARGLPLPNYSPEYVKWHRPSTAFYSRQWLANLRKEERLLSIPPAAGAYFLVPESLFLVAHASPPPTMPNVTALFQKTQVVILELDGLIHYPAAIGWGKYGKGLYLEMGPENTVLATEVVVSHPGRSMTKAGISRGKYYRVDENCAWHIVPNADECDCGDELHHARHLSVVGRFEEMLADNSFSIVRENVFAVAGIDSTNAPGAHYIHEK